MAMKRRFAAVIAAFWFLTSFLAAQDAPLRAAALDEAAVSAFADAYLAKAMEENRIPGAAIAIVAGGRSIYERGYGLADVAAGRPVDPARTLFRLCSVSKLFIADAVLQLRDEGKLSLEDEAATLAPSVPLRNPSGKPVTMAMLLSHTSGIDDQRVGDLSRAESAVRPPLRDFLARRMMPVTGLPGAGIRYSSYGAAYAACVVEELSGATFERWAADRVFSPLGMGDTRYAMSDPDLAKGYRVTEKGSWEECRLDGSFNLYPVGGALSTAADMARYLASWSGGPRPLHPEATEREMLARQAGPDPRLPGTAYGFAERFVGGRRLLCHSGYSPDNVSVDLLLDPVSGLGVFIAVNQGMNDVPREFAAALVERFAPPRKEVPESAVGGLPSEAELASLAGTYRFNEFTHSTLDKISAFPDVGCVTITRSPDGILRYEGRDEFSGAAASSDLEAEGGLAFRKVDGSGFVVFSNAGGRMTMAETGSSWHGSYERLAWYEAPAVQIIVLLACLAIFAAVPLSFVGTGILRRLRRSGLRGSALSSRLAAALCLSNITFCFGAVFGFADCIYGVSALGIVVLAIPLATTLLAIGIGIAAFVRKRERNAQRMTLAGIVIAAQAVFAVFLNYWNWLGFKF